MSGAPKCSRRAALGWMVRGTAVLALGGCSLAVVRRDPATLIAGDVLLLDELAETIVPATPGLGGARAASVGLYMLATVNECWPRADAQAFVRGLDALDGACAAAYGKPFLALAPEQKAAFLTRMENDPAGGPMVAMLKRLTVRGYLTSEIGATQALRYEPVPGSYRIIPYAKGDRRWSSG